MNLPGLTFISKKTTKVVVGCLLAFALLLTGSLDATGPEKPSLQASSKASIERIEHFEWELTDSGRKAGVLILLKEQAAVEEAVEAAQQSFSSMMSQDDRKAFLRRHVYESLRDTALQSQASLLGFLHREQNRGRVSQIKSHRIVNVVSAEVDKAFLDVLADRPEVDSIWPDESIVLYESSEEVKAYSDEIGWNLHAIGAPKAWDTWGIDGAGVVVGIIDTGVDWQHEALIQNYRGYDSLVPNEPDHAYQWFDPYHEKEEPDDVQGHGSLVTGAVVGYDPVNEVPLGPAPKAKWMAARGLDENGAGGSSYILACMEFMLAPTPNSDGSGEPDPTMAPDIVNNSWGGSAECNPIFVQAIDNWRAAEILPVFAAGNKGPEEGTICLPANYEESFAVGAVDSDLALAEFSSRGPSSCTDRWKPNVTAPGVKIRSVQSYAPDRERGYVWRDGTSLAAPHVAGTAALLRAANAALTVEELEDILMYTASSLTDEGYPLSPNHGYGHGLIDAFQGTATQMESFFYPTRAVLSSEQWQDKVIEGDVFVGPKAYLDIEETEIRGDVYVYGSLVSQGGLRVHGTVYALEIREDETEPARGTAVFLGGLYIGESSQEIEEANHIDAWDDFSQSPTSSLIPYAIFNHEEVLNAGGTITLKGAVLPVAEVSINKDPVDLPPSGLFAVDIQADDHPGTVLQITDGFGDETKIMVGLFSYDIEAFTYPDEVGLIDGTGRFLHGEEVVLSAELEEESPYRF